MHRDKLHVYPCPTCQPHKFQSEAPTKLKCTEVKSLMVNCEFDSDVHNPSYCSGVEGVLGCFGTVHIIENKTWNQYTTFACLLVEHNATLES